MPAPSPADAPIPTEASASAPDPAADGGRKRRAHEAEKAKRTERLARGVFGAVAKAVLPRGVITLDHPPGYSASRYTARNIARDDDVDRRLDQRCFFTGVLCSTDRSGPANELGDPRQRPWLGTKDHLVPLRRDVPGTPVDPARFPSTMIWASSVANGTLGLAPLLVRLKIRDWLASAPFDRADTSLAAGLNVRWLLIEYLDEFRLGGRFPWSRDEHGRWWDPGVSVPFMRRMWEAERRFLALDEAGRDAFIQNLSWQF